MHKLISAVSSIGYLLGPLLGGVLSNHHFSNYFNLALPFYVASALAIFTALSILFILQEKSNHSYNRNDKAWMQKLNVIKRSNIVAQDVNLKWLLIGGLFLTLAIDTYYEFYPAFLVKQWHMSAMDIAFFNAVLSLALIFGTSFLPALLVKKVNTHYMLIMMTIVFPIFFILMLITSNPYYLYVQFIAIGLSYGAASTLYTVLLSDSAPSNRQGEVMGLRWGLRMLGDALMCVFGGLLIALSINLPIIGALFFAIISLMIFYWKVRVKMIKSELE